MYTYFFEMCLSHNIILVKTDLQSDVVSCFFSSNDYSNNICVQCLILNAVTVVMSFCFCFFFQKKCSFKSLKLSAQQHILAGFQ